MNGTVLLLAAGSGTRLGAAGPKSFVTVGGRPMVERAARAAAAATLVRSIVVAVPEGAEGRTEDHLGDLPIPVSVVAGGPSRHASARIALAGVTDAEAVAVHDAARCLCPPGLFDECLRELDRCEAAVACAPMADTLKRGRGGWVTATVDRAGIWAAQTPQAVRTDLYRRAHAEAEALGFESTDDATLVERLGARVRIVSAPGWNLKITTPDDLALAEALLGRSDFEAEETR